MNEDQTETNRRQMSEFVRARDGNGGWRFLAITTEPPTGEPFAPGIITMTLHGADSRKSALQGGTRAAREQGIDKQHVRVLRLMGTSYYLDIA